MMEASRDSPSGAAVAVSAATGVEAVAGAASTAGALAAFLALGAAFTAGAAAAVVLTTGAETDSTVASEDVLEALLVLTILYYTIILTI